MNARDEVAELGSLLRSRFPIVLIESHEEPRILELLAKVCNLENQVLMTWSITSGIRRHGRDEAIYRVAPRLAGAGGDRRRGRFARRFASQDRVRERGRQLR